MTDLSKNIQALRERKPSLRWVEAKLLSKSRSRWVNLLPVIVFLSLVDKNSFDEYDLFCKARWP